MAEPYDNWHKQQTRRGERRCLDHDSFPSAYHGRGSRWMARWRDSEGRQRSASFDRFEQAQRHQRKMESDAASSQRSGAQNAELRLTGASALWPAGRRSKNVRTNAQSESRVRMHIDDPIGFLHVREIKPSTIVEWINGRRAVGLDETTIGLVLTHLSAILERCVDDELIHRNPCRAKSVRSVKPKRSKKTAAKVPLTGRQAAAVRDNLPARYKALTDVGRALGLRQGEIFGLSPDDIDWTRKKICIRRQVARHGNKLVFRPREGQRARRRT